MSDTADLYKGSLAPDEAVARLIESVARNSRTQTVKSDEAAGRFLAADAVAASNLPATNNAAVDGYAVGFFLEANPEHDFRIVGRAAAQDTPMPALSALVTP